MAQFTNSQLFATPNAPYIKYLEKIRGQWPEADALNAALKRLTQVVERYHEPISANKSAKVGEFVNTAEILDIHHEVNGKQNSIKTPSSSLGTYNGLTLSEPCAIENFLHQLRSCEPCVHTRIIVLHNGRYAPGDRAADSLFFCHVLGVELDLPPADVRNLTQLDRHEDGNIMTVEQPRQRLPMKPGFVSLGFSEETRKRSVAAYIGRRKMGSAAPHVVVVRLQARGYEPHQLMLGSVGNLWEPPVQSESLQQSTVPARNPHHPWPSTSATVLFKHAVRRSLLPASPLRSDDLTGSWLSALIYMDTIVLADRLDDLVSDWQNVSKKLSTKELELNSEMLGKLSQSAEEIRASLQTSVNQVAAFRKSYPAARYSDFGEAYHFLNRLLGDAKPISGEIKDEVNRQQENLNLQVSRTALEESRSAISLTILAFIFIPINTASSIFGMNVKEIGESTSIWAFVTIACALTMCSGLGWFLWRAPWKKWWFNLRWSLKIPVSDRERKRRDLELCERFA